MISYSIKALRGLAYLYKSYNDLDVYVEDTTTLNFYKILINRILDGKANVDRVFQLGGRDAVLNECANDQELGGRPRIYIIDADFDLLLGRSKSNLKRLYRLNVYCAENLVLCEEAVHQIGVDYMPNDNIATIKSTINYDDFINDIKTELLELFFVYALAHDSRQSISTAGFHVFRMCDSNAGPAKLDKPKVQLRKQEVIRELNSFYTVSGVRSRIDTIIQRFQNNGYSELHVISGKSYLLPLVLAHMKRTINYKGSIKTFLMQLVRHSRLDIDKELTSAILMASKGL
ncbi:MAG: DUF4435 domain-containing protein [Thermodesulfobacteriota bacterium]